MPLSVATKGAAFSAVHPAQRVMFVVVLVLLLAFAALSFVQGYFVETALILGTLASQAVRQLQAKPTGPSATE